MQLPRDLHRMAGSLALNFIGKIGRLRPGKKHVKTMIRMDDLPDQLSKYTQNSH